MYEVERYHDISAGHRVVGHEGKCRHLHGHNYRVTFTCTSAENGLDDVGRVIDFGLVKTRLCMWLEDCWDHRMLIWTRDPQRDALCDLDPQGVIIVPFNPTAENMAEYLATVVAPHVMKGTGVLVTRVRVEETRKCSASYTLGMQETLQFAHTATVNIAGDE